MVKNGRTHLQDAVPITFGQKSAGWRSMLEHARDMIRASLAGLYELALGEPLWGRASTPRRALTRRKRQKRWPG